MHARDMDPRDKLADDSTANSVYPYHVRSIPHRNGQEWCLGDSVTPQCFPRGKLPRHSLIKAPRSPTPLPRVMIAYNA